MLSSLKISSRLSKKYKNITKTFGHFSTYKTDTKPIECGTSTPCAEETTAVVLGTYRSGDNIILSDAAKLLDHRFGGRLTTVMSKSQPYPEIGETRVFHGLDPVYSPVVVASLGKPCNGYNSVEQLDERKEIIRTAAAAGIRALDDFNVHTTYVESFGHAESAAEGASMAAWMYQDVKSCKRKIKRKQKISLFNSCDFTGWQIGLQKAAAQNLARFLQEKPGNDMSPQKFAQSVVELLSKYNINVEVRMEQWARRRNLNAFLAVAKGSCDPPIFLEIFYEGCETHVCPIVLVGKGVTFNSGGLCLHRCKSLQYQRGDMAGASAVVAAIRAVAILKLPINVRGLIPLCSNMLGPLAYKPGDIVKAHNGKTIRVGSTRCEGLLMHADALSYSREYKPKLLLDVGTLTPDMIGALGEAASGCFSNNESLYEMMRIASIHTGDRIWRLPLWYYFRDYMKNKPVSDYSNHTPKLIGGGPCKAAAFLREFIPPDLDWIHLDTFNVMRTNGKDFKHLRKGMSGRPTRTIIEFLAQFACTHEK